MDPDFEELSNDADLINRLKKFSKATDNMKAVIDKMTDPDLYDDLSRADKIAYNLTMSFTLNSLFWMYLRAEGIDPTTHQIKSENDRLKESMRRAQEIKDKKNMPRLNKDVAKRFVRSGLWTPNDNNVDGGTNQEDERWDVVSVVTVTDITTPILPETI